ncbi:MAG TPA: exodeoxyribonuclease III [Candidatus Merdivicinus intestinavium]|nr:exodeoxyribonuclease III [Candidatus Merdivicinus intestinavium]
MKLISWNVNGLRACMGKGFPEFFAESGADIFCLQETKLQPEQADFQLGSPGEYRAYWNSAEKKGYSGTAVFSKTEPLDVRYGIGLPEHDREGRVITAEYPDFYLVNVYTPNSQRELTRLAYRMEWEDAFRGYLTGLDARKPVIACGDMNVAHQEIDLKNPKTNRRNAGFTDEEREKMTKLLGAGFLDSFRFLYPDKAGVYSWWSYMFKAREKNAGWRIDYFLVSEKLRDRIEDSLIYTDVLGSDHCPVGLILKGGE